MANNTKPETSSGQSWIYSSMNQLVHPMANLAVKLGSLMGIFNAESRMTFLNWNHTEEENKRLVNIWRDAGTVFITLQVLAQKNDERKIFQIGMSGWWPDNFNHIHSLYTEVEEATPDSLLPQQTFKFLFGETEVIAEHDIGPWLQCTFKALQGTRHTACLVGYDIRRILHLVQPYWSVPHDVMIVDTRVTQGFQIPEHSSFRQPRQMHHQLDESLLDNAGNAAQLALESFQRQVREIEEILDAKKNTLNLYTSYDGYHF